MSGDRMALNRKLYRIGGRTYIYDPAKAPEGAVEVGDVDVVPTPEPVIAEELPDDVESHPAFLALKEKYDALLAEAGPDADPAEQETATDPEGPEGDDSVVIIEGDPVDVDEKAEAEEKAKTAPANKSRTTKAKPSK